MHRFAVAIIFIVTLAGCQCSRVTERYCDAVDHVADYEPNLERLYCPCADLTRIGHPDWCRCRVNRLWCRHGCCAEADARKALCCPFCAQYHPPYAAQADVQPAGGDIDPGEGAKPADGKKPAVPPKPDYDDGMPPKPKTDAKLPVWSFDESMPAVPTTQRTTHSAESTSLVQRVAAKER